MADFVSIQSHPFSPCWLTNKLILTIGHFYKNRGFGGLTFKKAKRAFYFEEIQKTAQKGLDEYGVSDEMLMNFAKTSIHIENNHGLSAWGSYANGNKMISDLKQMISDKKDETTIRCFINTQKATYRQRIYMENIFAQAMDNNALRVA